MIDLEYLTTLMPLNIHEFRDLINEQISQNKNYLIDNWLHECADTISQHKASLEAFISKNNQVLLFILC